VREEERMNEMLRLERFFMGEPDRCERLISGLHYCMCLGPEGDLQQEEQLYLVSTSSADAATIPSNVHDVLFCYCGKRCWRKGSSTEECFTISPS
jgi:hypothetical protein